MKVLQAGCLIWMVAPLILALISIMFIYKIASSVF
jgi:hypothetical protein